MATRMMSCREVGLRLQSYLDGELDDGRMNAIRAHLDACVDCGVEASVFERIKADLAESAPQNDPDALARLRAFSEEIASNVSE